ncbi:MAG: WHG domain-containing protein [Solirubrobacteraceae bacterium]|nr:WHG domain-containing protein [Solirubrobacteraceae bacterium]
MARGTLDQRQVVEAAATMADADGLEATTLSALARELGVRTPSLYKHVDSLQALHRLLALRAIAELTAAVTEAATGRSGPAAVRASADAWRAYAHAHPGLYAASGPFSAPSDDAEYVAATDGLLTALQGILRAWELEGDDAVDAIRGLRAAIHGFVMLEQSGGFGLPRGIDASFGRMIDTLVTGLGTPH